MKRTKLFIKYVPILLVCFILLNVLTFKVLISADPIEINEIEADIVFNTDTAEVFSNFTPEVNTEIIIIEKPVEVPVEKEIINEIEIIPLTMKELGSFKLTAYCPCSICCGKWSAPPEGKCGATGVGIYEGISFAVDPSIVPYGTKLYVEGVGVGIATDCGGGIKKNRIDVYFTSHKEALSFDCNLATVKVYKIIE